MTHNLTALSEISGYIILLNLKILQQFCISGFWKRTQGAWNLVAPTSSWVLLQEMFTASSLGLMKSNFLMSAPFNQVKTVDVRVDVNNQISMKLDQLMSSGNIAVSISLKLLFRYESQIHHQVLTFINCPSFTLQPKQAQRDGQKAHQVQHQHQAQWHLKFLMQKQQL